MPPVLVAQAGDVLGLDRAQELLRVLAEPIRLQVVQQLSQGERCVCELTTALDLAQPKLSFHLRVMRQAGLITARQQGRWVYYRLQPGLLLQLRDWLGDLAVSCSATAATNASDLRCQASLAGPADCAAAF